MRPILLQVAGLQSFREKQSIDFDTLCGGGVFGIFGPTGSGKSSILDAITLALYGKVERAAGGTQGILNHAEDTLSVSFTFELGVGSAPSRYKIERNYKRTGEHTVRTSTCRLLEKENDNWVVHADKERDVTQQVQQLLGLTIEDFTRAVVLPQGKFAEFLSLKGAERRQMLQRLFQLEKYGDSLNQKLKKRVEEAKGIMDHLSAEQAGLGDASKEALKDAEMAWNQAQQDVAIKRKETEAQEQSYEKNRQIWQAQVQLKALEEEEARLQTNAGRIQTFEQKLQNARTADLLMPYGDAAEKAEQEWAYYIKREEELRVQTYQAKERADDTDHRHEEAKKEKENQEPLLIARKEQLLTAIEMEKEACLKKKSAQEKEQILTEQKQQQRSVHSQQKAAEELLHKAINRQNELQMQLKATSVSSADRERINRAVEYALEMDYTAKQFREANAAFDKTIKLLGKNKDESERLNEKKKQLENKIQQTGDRILALYNELSDLQYGQELMTHTAEEMEEQLVSKREQDQAKVLAAKLSEQLMDGEPCMVCGSLDHPHPMEHFKPDEEAAGQIQQMKGIQRDSAELKNEILLMKSRMERMSEDLYQYLEKSEAAASLFSSPSEKQISLHSLSDLNQQLQAAQVSVKGLRQDILQIEDETRKIRSEFHELSSVEHTVNAQLDNLKKEAEECREKLDEQESALKQQQTNWQDRFPDLPPEQVKEEKERVRTLDAQREKIEEGLLKAVPFIEEKEKIIEDCRKQIIDIDRSITKLEIEDSSLVQEYKRLIEKAERITGGQDAGAFLQQTEQKISSLSEQVTRFEAQRKAALDHYHTKDKEWRSALDAKEKSKQRKEESLIAWEEKRKSSPFESLEKLRECLASEQDQKTWKSEIDVYYDQCKRTESEKRKIAHELNGASLTQEQWDEITASLQRMKEELQTAIQKMGEAGQYHKGLEMRHVRYNELETEKREVEEQLKTLGKLQAVFRGNSFVEYVAEEQLVQVSRDASNRLAQLTRGRYAIEVDSSNGFVIRDDANGGVKRPISTLSGGETFLTSLALALSLSTQIQLRGKYPLEFFFLDEGFGTLDQELLDTVVTALEKLHTNALSVGIISHVPELKARLTKKLIVTPANAEGNGSRTAIENT
ncbi:AAA family ATPase [Fictibacillus sp. KIGAM418]|uniref:Nuclease SbcCD subunit C n=1 Tax=Fictibacillus marinisediminis TaxID=2878389 RepID=A0A9X1X9T3_9BACL|nr:AAA family ATPase [Fictibacillus marinisediminis]MCK6256671.1 AAA family ATPase [Fictibacillus marinisediminis]